MQILIRVLIICCLFSTAYGLAEDIYPFTSSQQQVRFEKLTKELRCVVCQNESLADSNAPLAKDLRFQIYQMVEKNKTNSEIVHYLVSRYGEFVEFHPKFNVLTFVLWAGPFIVLMMVCAGLYRRIKKHKLTKNNFTLSSNDQKRVKQLLNE